MGDDVLTIREVAAYLKVNTKTVYGLAQQHRIPGFKVGGQWRFRRADIETWIQVQTSHETTDGKQQPVTTSPAPIRKTGGRGQSRR